MSIMCAVLFGPPELPCCNHCDTTCTVCTGWWFVTEVASPVDVPISAPTYVSFSSLCPYFMKLFSVLKIFLMQMVVFVLTVVTCPYSTNMSSQY